MPLMTGEAAIERRKQLTLRTAIGKPDCRSLPWSTYERAHRTHAHVHSAHTADDREMAHASYWPYASRRMGAVPRRMGTPYAPVPPTPIAPSKFLPRPLERLPHLEPYRHEVLHHEPLQPIGGGPVAQLGPNSALLDPNDALLNLLPGS